MKTLGVVINPRREKARDVFAHLERLATSKGLVVEHGETSSDESDEAREQIVRLANRVDAVISLGGDGTLLRAARAVGDRGIPVVGVNVGSLGFLTSVSEEDLERTLDCLVSGKYLQSRRAVLDCCVIRGGEEVCRFRALNDVVMNAGGSTRVVTLRIDVDGRELNTYICDGIIAATPTGSTGHNLSAGGPIVSPEASVLLATVLCPHTLSARPMVLPDESVITVTVNECACNMVLSVDGQHPVDIQQGDCVTLRKSPHALNLVQLEGYDYFSVLRQKLHWRGMNY